VLLSGAVSAATPPPGSVQLDRSIRVHPKLQYGAQVEPDKVVRVLVQKSAPSHDSRDIARAGGSAQVREDFGAVNTSVMEVKQKDVLQLAKDPRVVYISPDGDVPVKKDRNDEREARAIQLLARSSPKPVTSDGTPPDAAKLLTTYPKDVHAPAAWTDKKGSLTGAGVTVAVLDTGVNPFHPDLDGKVFPVFVNPNATGYLDGLGHGTHVIGIVNGESDDDHYVGIAPDARVISVKIADDKGAALESDMLRGLQWVYDNHARYNIKVVNLSLSAATPQSYHLSPIDAAVELLWRSGITVVASAGNRGTASDATWYAPGNDPFVITVGCLDDNQTTTAKDDSVCSFSSRGQTQDHVAKPDLVAPGRKIVAPLAAKDVQLAIQYPDRISADGAHIRLSGTSMATPVVSGAAAVILQRYPNLTPNQVKWLLDTTAHRYTNEPDKANELDIAKAIEAGKGDIHEANHGLHFASLFEIATGGAGNANANGYWNNSYWNNAYWDNSYWNNSYWDNSYWDNSYWNNSYWDNSYWDNSYWDNAGALD
jgi:serine protease AprX